MKKYYILLSYLLMMFPTFTSVTSCTARKSETAKKEETTKTDYSAIFRNSGNAQEFVKSDFKLQTNYNFNFSNLSKSESEEFNVSPIDSKKPATYIDPKGNKHILENATLTNKKSTEEKNIKTDISQNTIETLKTDIEKKSKYIIRLESKIKAIADLSEKNKKTENEGFSLSNYLLLLIPIGLMFVAWKVYKNLNPLS